jgi:dTDP-4-dehydrorhamnose reductase
MKILLLGDKGYLGSYINENLTVDVLEKREIYNNGKQYNYIINCIGKPNLEYCEDNPLETNYSNFEVIKDIILFYPNSKIINFSSYYVYDDFGYCTEESKITNRYKYCEQKINGENLIKNGVSFRVGKLFGHSDLLKQNKLTEHIIKNDNLTLDNVSFNPTSLSQVLKIIQFEITNNKLFGIYNLSNYGDTTHYNYGCYINDLLGTNKKIIQIPEIKRTFLNYGKFLMSTEKLNKIYELTPWKTDLKNYIQSL